MNLKISSRIMSLLAHLREHLCKARRQSRKLRWYSIFNFLDCRERRKIVTTIYSGDGGDVIEKEIL